MAKREGVGSETAAGDRWRHSARTTVPRARAGTPAPPASERHRQPSLAVDLIVECGRGIVLVERKNEPKGYALPGGFVDDGETLEQAAVREAKEETGLDVTLVRQFHAYSDPARDPRRHTVSVVFVATARGRPRGGDDARSARIFPLDRLPKLCFDHGKILEDYLLGRY